MRGALHTPLSTAARTLLFRRVDFAHAGLSRWPVLPLLALLFLTALVVQYRLLEQGSALNWPAVPVWLLQAFLGLLLVQLVAPRADSPVGWVALMLGWAQGLLITVLLYAPLMIWLLPRLPQLADGWAGFVLFVVLTLWQALALAVCLVRWDLLSRWRAALYALLLLLASAVQVWFFNDADRLWVWSEAESQAFQREYAPPRLASERHFYAEPALLAERLAAIAPGTPGQAELFAIAVGGDASQQVFLRESSAYAALAKEQFGAQAHTLLLANHDASAGQVPIATLTSIAAGIRRAAQQMNPDEDALLLYLTSHGGPGPRHRFVLDSPPLELAQLDPQWLRGTLDAAGVRWRIIIVSACYSGGYLKPLADAQTLVITAADADNTSFGCADENHFTDFGRALYDGLRKESGWAAAFAAARREVGRREKELGLTPSNPQWLAGAAIQPRLAGWFRRAD
ncbi:C13 family peptidase [Chitinilyticum litopenaei]|uniref:C13 family peptidase n=1 Tax=Chitinilyticum litopenaei TaxID=1121276 RepID=UPI0003FA5510|nr:C13 family peptidase [Chitinilyticum litopenaei]